MAKKSHDATRDAEALLRRDGVRAPDLVAAIHAVNPTTRDLRPEDERRAYALKSRLQSRLIVEFFDELSLEVVPGQPGVLSVRYRPQDRDACHAVLSELESEARSKVQFHLDTVESQRRVTGSGAPRPRRAIAADSDAFQQGLRALDQFDLLRARECFETAVSQSDDEAPMLALLRVLDDLASWQDALALSPSLSSRQLTPSVRALLAVAAAQLGDAVTCRKWLKHDHEPAFARPLCLLAQDCVSHGDVAEATRLLAEARALAPAEPQLLIAEKTLAEFKTAQREPAERALDALLAAGESEAAERKSREILQRWPESGSARRVVREAESKALMARLTQLERDAQAACAAGDDHQAIALWSEARQLGAPELEARIGAAAARLDAARRSRGRAEVMTRLGACVDEAALTAYFALGLEDRAEVRATAREPVLDWLEELGSSGDRKDLAAVLALREATRAPVELRDALVTRHRERLRGLELGRAVLAELAAHAEAIAQREALQSLALARAALAAGDWRRAVTLTEQLVLSGPSELKEQCREVADVARARLESSSRLQRFEALLGEGRELDALFLLNTAERDETADQGPWIGHRKTITERLRRSFRVQTWDSPADCNASDLARLRFIAAPSHALEHSGAFAYWVTSHRDQLFVRKIDVQQQRVVLLIALQTPEALPFPEALVEGETLWVTAGGVSVRLSTRTWDVLAWFPGMELPAGEKFQQALPPLGGRFQWLRVANGSKTPQIRIVDLERGRMHRELAKDAFGLGLVATERGARVWVAGDRRGGALHEPGGAVDTTLPPQASQVAAAPIGAGLIMVSRPVDADESADPGGIQIIHQPGAGAPSELVEELTDSFNDGIVIVATSLEAQASFVLYPDVERVYWLVCYGMEHGKLQRRWRLPCPQPCYLFQDLQAQRVVLVAAQQSGLSCISLTAGPPALSGLAAVPDLRASSDGLACAPWRKTELMPIVRTLSRTVPPAVVQQALELACEDLAHDPHGLAALAGDLRSVGQTAGAQHVMNELRDLFPRHPATVLDRAEQALEKRDWTGVLGALESAPRSEFPPRAGAHLEHVRGLALFELGRLAEAKEAFEAANSEDETGCSVAGWPDWIDALQGEEADSPAGQLISLMKRAQAALAAKDSRNALELLDVPLVWRSLDVQLAARLLIAVHDVSVIEGDIPGRTRLIAAAFLELCEGGDRHRGALPLGPLAITPDRLAEYELQARAFIVGPTAAPATSPC
ncbi:MAG: hypothetical protein Q8L48_22210 [Archangium sp.]|nr:hypothetical protein [Archangium sp.]